MRFKTAAVFLSAALLTAGCGADDKTETDPGTSEAPNKVTASPSKQVFDCFQAAHPDEFIDRTVNGRSLNNQAYDFEGLLDGSAPVTAEDAVQLGLIDDSGSEVYFFKNETEAQQAFKFMQNNPPENAFQIDIINAVGSVAYTLGMGHTSKLIREVNECVEDVAGAPMPGAEEADVKQQFDPDTPRGEVETLIREFARAAEVDNATTACAVIVPETEAQTCHNNLESFSRPLKGPLTFTEIEVAEAGMLGTAAFVENGRGQTVRVGLMGDPTTSMSISSINVQR